MQTATTAQQQEEKVSLYYTEGGSDKVYHAQLTPSGDGFLVNVQYGRRGAALTFGTKTASPLPYATAKKTFDKVVREKTSKGYTPDVSGAAYQGTENAGNKTDFAPQLLNSITEEEAMRLIEDDDWVMSEKKDGERRGATAVTGEDAYGMNRKGLSVPLPQSVADELQALSAGGEIRLDAEIIGEVLHVFDLLTFDGNAIGRMLGWLTRMELAEKVLAECKQLRPLYVAKTTAEKRALWAKVKEARGEGFVFKRRNCLATAGRPNSGGDWLKYKFVERASCVVLKINTTKRSVQLGMIDDNGHSGVKVASGQPVVLVGNCTILPNFQVPEVDDVVDIDYLYAFHGGCMYQLVYRGVRNDIEVSACRTSQLKYKPAAAGGDQDEEDEG